MRKLFFLFLTLVATTSLLAQRFQVGDLYYNITSSSAPYAVEVSDAVSSITSADIPSTVTHNGTTYSVTSIGSSAFAYCSALTSVTIPNSVTSIGYRAFYGCSSLTSVTIPNSVTSIGEWTFYDCRSLTSITIPNSVTSIGDYAFNNCSLTSVTINSDAIVNKTYSYSSNISDIFGSQVTEYIIGDDVKGIGYAAFEWCSSLTSITIGNSVTSIGDYAFWYCSSLTSVTIPNSVTSIGDYAFDNCSSLTSVTINSDAIVNNKTYSSSSNISDIFGSQVTEYIIGDDVKGIGDWAFAYCSSLTSITIPNSVTSIGDWAFASCSSLTSVTIPNSVKSIGDGVFYGCCSLTSVTIPNSVTSIGDQAFDGCSSLTSITIPNSVTSIGDGAFYYCSSLTSITIPNSVEGIGGYAFYGCSSLTSVTIPNSVTSIGDWAFAKCEILTSVTIPNSVTSIGDAAFWACSSLDTITCLAMTPPALGREVFYGCDNPTLFVPCAALSDYQLHEQWGQFTTIECIASEEAETEEVVIESGTTTVIITWPTEEGADTYTIVIKKDGEVVCTLTFNSEGQLINIAFAPGRDGNHPVQYAEAVANGGYRFTVTGLEDGTHYTYDITVKDASNQTIATYSGEFTTKGGTTTAVEDILQNTTNVQKLLRNGQLIILRDGVEYNAMGQEL